MTKMELINGILNANVEYPMIVLSEADWKGGRQCCSVFGEQAQSLIDDGPADFDYIEFIAWCNDDLYRAIVKDISFTDEYDTENGRELEERPIMCFVPWN